MIRLIDEKTGAFVKSFTASTKYFIRTPADGLPLKRASMLRSVLSVAGFDATFGEQLQALSRMSEYADEMLQNKTGFTKLAAEIEGMKKAIHEAQNRNWDYSAYACTYFIVTENEDLTVYDERMAETKLEDWNKAPIHFMDFFFCSMLWEATLNEGLTKYLVKLNSQKR